MQLYDLSFGEYLVNKYALWLDFRMIDENKLHRTGRPRIENASEGITLQIEKKAESAGADISLEYEIATQPDLTRSIRSECQHMALLYDRILRHRKIIVNKSDTV